MVQMIFARRGEGLPLEGSAIGSCGLGFNRSPQSVVVQFGTRRRLAREILPFARKTAPVRSRPNNLRTQELKLD